MFYYSYFSLLCRCYNNNIFFINFFFFHLFLFVVTCCYCTGIIPNRDFRRRRRRRRRRKRRRLGAWLGRRGMVVASSMLLHIYSFLSFLPLLSFHPFPFLSSSIQQTRIYFALCKGLGSWFGKKPSASLVVCIHGIVIIIVVTILNSLR